MYIQLADIANDRLLKAAAIYGANASGKSNVYEAFEHMSYYVKESINFGGEDEGSRREKNGYLKVINKVSRDEALARKYLTGSYGVVPALKPN